MEAGVLMFWFVFLTVVVGLVATGRWTSRRSRRLVRLVAAAASGPSDPMQDGSRFFM